MTIKYPNGMSHSYDERTNKKKQVVSKTIPTEFGKRGMNFEEEINQSNVYYLNHNLAVIHKKPTPIQIVKVDYPRRSAAVIKEAYFRHASTTDYNGVYQGLYLDFEAKETKNKTSFPLSNFHEHQISHMVQCLKQQGVCFVLVWFSSLNRCFFMSGEEIIRCWNEQKQTNKKSIPLKTFEQIGIEIKLGIAPRIPYLAAVNEYLNKEKTHGRQ